MNLLYFVLIKTILLSTYHPTLSIIIQKDVSLTEEISNFEKDPTNSKYRVPFQPLAESFPCPYYILIYSPMLQQVCTILCPYHELPLTPSRWTAELSKQTRFNPRLLYCIHYNILLVQQYYNCPTCGNDREFLSCSKDVLHQIENKKFPYRMYRRSGYSHKLINYIFQQIGHGMNFQAISECIGNLHLEQYQFDVLDLNSCSVANFYSDKINSFPTRTALCNVYLDVFQERKAKYQKVVLDRIPNGTITGDHTFRVGKNIGAFRKEDENYVKEILKLFILMDADHYIIDWKLTKSTKFEEVSSLLSRVQSRMDPEQIRYIVLDNCCEMAKLYGNVFKGIPIKLDIFHAVQRLTRWLPDKMSSASRKVSEAIGQIFRQPSDRGPKRCLKTPSPEQIITNIEILLTMHNSYFQTLPESRKKEFFSALERLKVHINKGCLSGINPGDGTEGNERLHKMLNDSCLSGMSILGPELAVAILTLLFYNYNCKLDGKKHVSNSKVVLVPPVSMPEVFSEECPLVESSNDLYDNFEAHVVECSNELMLKNVIKEIQKVEKVLKGMKNTVVRRKYVLTDILNNRYLPRDILSPNSYHLDIASYHAHMLELNCYSFNRIIKNIARDGDCLFRSLLDLIQHHPQFLDQATSFRMHLASFGFNFDNIDTDILKLRALFVCEMKNNPRFHPFIDVSDTDVDSFKRQGVFASNIGDLVVGVCSDILKTPVVVICSMTDMLAEPFFPTEAVTDEPLYLAYNNHECHYSSTIINMSNNTHEHDEKKETGKCSCNSVPGRKTCLNVGGYLTRCPCLKAGRPCNSLCRCGNCGNSKEIEMPVDGCNCRLGKKDDLKSCVSIANRRACKCVCFKAKVPCTERCRCLNCGNTFGIRLNERVSMSSKKPRLESIPTIRKRLVGKEFFKSIDITPSQGKWTYSETIALYCCTDAVNDDSPDANIVLVHELYNSVVKHSNNPLLRYKSVAQILSKLNYMF